MDFWSIVIFTLTLAFINPTGLVLTPLLEDLLYVEESIEDSESASEKVVKNEIDSEDSVEEINDRLTEKNSSLDTLHGDVLADLKVEDLLGLEDER